MEAGARDLVELELKYCERCGGLWLRRRDVDVEQVYCPSCVPKMTEFPVPRRIRDSRFPGGRGHKRVEKSDELCTIGLEDGVL
jgi:Zn-finger nucleic acid-binding protein